MKSRSLLAATVLGGSVAAAAFLGARFNPAEGTPSGDWYRRLKKSPLNPPDAVFGPVWSALYLAMAASAYRVWTSPEGDDRSRALRLWYLQLALNASWSPLFFGAKQPLASLADLSALLATQVSLARTTARVDRPAAWLLAPYIAWVTFAGYLNAEVVRRNRPEAIQGSGAV